jgi:hypothetical protein
MLEDGSSIFIESEDGELEGKNAFVADAEGNPTEEAAPNGTHLLRDGRSITIEEGVVTSVQEATDEVENLKNTIAELEAKLQEKEEAEAKSNGELEEAKSQMLELIKDVENLKKMTVGGDEPVKKPYVKPQNKFDTLKETGHVLDDFAKQIYNKHYNQN